MTPKEDFLAAMRHRKPESVPIYGPPVRYLIGNLDWFESPPEGGLDGFGVQWTPTTIGPMRTGDYILTDITRWREQVTIPDMDQIDWAAKAKADLANYKPEENVMLYSLLNGPFQRMLDLMNLNELTYAFYDEPNACHDFLDAYLEYRLKELDYIGQYYHPEFVALCDNVAFASGIFIAPDCYRTFIKPIHISINKKIRAIGAVPINHCCGKAEIFIEDFLEEGAQAWSSCQPCNDIATLIQRYHKDYTFIGGFDTNGPPSLPSASEAERRAEVHRVIDSYAGYGSFVFGNHAMVKGDTPEQGRLHRQQITEEVLSYGKNYYLRNQ